MNENKQYNNNRSMKRTVRLTESELRNIIVESVKRIIKEGDNYCVTNKNELEKQLDKFLYDISWHESVGFETSEECNFIIDKLQSEYNFKLTKSYDNNRKTSTIILKGKTPKENVNITLEFYPNGDEYNEEPWCDLKDVSSETNI